MLRYIHARDLHAYPRLSASMFRDRADQFATRLGWDVTVDADGLERDGYDDMDPLYVIAEGPEGLHRGSMRFLPTTGDTMIRDHFSDIAEADICSPAIWECTRFCLARGASPTTAAALMLAGGELMRAFSLTHFVGVFDARMIRIYARTGASPEVLGVQGTGRDAISVGLWSFGDEARARLIERSGIPSDLSERWFAEAFGHAVEEGRAAA